MRLTGQRVACFCVRVCFARSVSFSSLDRFYTAVYNDEIKDELDFWRADLTSAMIELWQRLTVVLVVSCYACSCDALMSNASACVHQPLTYNEVKNHLGSASNLFFLFGIDVHRPFLNEHDQLHADASVFIISICASNSLDCIAKRGSLPAEYQLKFTIDGLSFDAAHADIDRQWHRAKRSNHPFLYEPVNSHGWYDEPANEHGSIWTKYIMNRNNWA